MGDTVSPNPNSDAQVLILEPVSFILLLRFAGEGDVTDRLTCGSWDGLFHGEAEKDELRTKGRTGIWRVAQDGDGEIEAD